MAFVNEYVKEIIELEVALFHARARLEVSADDEALHDLRICIRRIRSLLSPLRSIAATSSATASLELFADSAISPVPAAVATIPAFSTERRFM